MCLYKFKNKYFIGTLKLNNTPNECINLCVYNRDLLEIRKTPNRTHIKGLKSSLMLIHYDEKPSVTSFCAV